MPFRKHVLLHMHLLRRCLEGQGLEVKAKLASSVPNIARIAGAGLYKPRP